jgi:glycosyltransferase involved in cell wall biosynthesis
MSPSQVSVIIPVKNGERFLGAAINSVLAQSRPPFEIIVIDGQSTDATAGIARSFSHLRYFYQSGFASIAHARNLGIAEARGGLIAFISHDDLWDAYKLKVQVEYLETHPEIQYVISRVKFFIEPGCDLPPGFRRELLASTPAGPMPETLLARKSLFASLGGFNPELGLLEDNDWFSRARDNHIASAVIPEVLVHKRIHDANLSIRPSLAAMINRDMLRVAKNSIERKRSRALKSRDT